MPTGSISAAFGPVYHLDTGSQAMTPTEIRLVKKLTYACSQRTCSFHSCADDCKRDGCDWACGQGVCTNVPCPTLRNPAKFRANAASNFLHDWSQRSSADRLIESQ
jgi:hypothetical protein